MSPRRDSPAAAAAGAAAGQRCRSCDPRKHWKPLVLIFTIGGVLGVVSVTFSSGKLVPFLDRTAHHFRALPLGLLLLCLYLAFSGLVVCGVANAPLSITSAALIATKVAFGPAWALSSCIAFASLVSGGLSAFALGKTILREWATGFAQESKVLRALDAALTRDGAKVSALMRASLPHALVNYGMACTAVGLPAMLAGFAGHLPWVLLYCFLGCSLDSAQAAVQRLQGKGGGGTEEALQLWGGLAALALLSVAITWFTQRSLRKAIAEAETEEAGLRTEADRMAAFALAVRSFDQEPSPTGTSAGT